MPAERLQPMKLAHVFPTRTVTAHALVIEVPLPAIVVVFQGVLNKITNFAAGLGILGGVVPGLF